MVGVGTLRGWPLRRSHRVDPIGKLQILTGPLAGAECRNPGRGAELDHHSETVDHPHSTV